METLWPFTHVVTNETVLNGENAYDGNPSTFATLQDDTEGQAAFVLWKFSAPAGPFDSVEVEIECEWFVASLHDRIRWFFRKVSTDPWTKIHDVVYPNVWSPKAVVTIDVKSMIGVATAWQLGCQYFNGPGSPQPPLEEI